ncbi:MAG: restriction endonuclease [Dehalococcoidia bacterium]|nr:restriction endonuclease [Dehalococcoidia bacterium]
MRRIDLWEHQPSAPLALAGTELQTLLGEAKALELSITPTGGGGNEFVVRPGSTVGAVETGGLSVLIRPKIGIPQLLSLACYAIGKVRFRHEDFDFPEEDALPDVLARALAYQARRAFSRGLLHGYRTEEEALYTVRGRIRFDEQIRRRSGVPLPVEVRYDEFTDDILENRLVGAAAHRLGGMRPRSQEARRRLGWIAGMLDSVSLVEFPGRGVPSVTFGRLNEHYRGVVELSRLILRHSAFESSRGEVRASGFLMDMNDVFQEFVTAALREALGLSARAFGEYGIPSLDKDGRVSLRPDLTWWRDRECIFVADVKYKNVDQGRVPNTDLYQLLAYVTALDLPAGLLVYAEGEADVATYNVRCSGKRLEVVALDLSGALDQVLARVGCLARKVRGLGDEARRRASAGVAVGGARA